MNTFVYIDGFNLYYGAVKDTPYKWLNVLLMCQALLPKNDILAIKYYTAKVSARPYDPGQPLRQQTYIRALETIPALQVVYGQFLQSKVRMALANPTAHGPKTVEVLKTEEKGSDVNIATHMVHDGHRGLYDVAVIVSNDSDLTEPVRIVRFELGKAVIVLNPHPKHPSQTLRQQATFVKPIRQGVLASCQFPEHLQDAKGSFHKPGAW